MTDVCIVDRRGVKSRASALPDEEGGEWLKSRIPMEYGRVAGVGWKGNSARCLNFEVDLGVEEGDTVTYDLRIYERSIGFDARYTARADELNEKIPLVWMRILSVYDPTLVPVIKGVGGKFQSWYNGVLV